MENEPTESTTLSAEVAIEQIFEQGPVTFEVELDGYEIRREVRPLDLAQDAAYLEQARSLMQDPALYLLLDRAQAEEIWRAITANVLTRRDALMAAATARLSGEVSIFTEIEDPQLPSEEEITSYREANPGQVDSLRAVLAEHPYFRSAKDELAAAIMYMSDDQYAAWQMTDLLAVLKQ